MKRRPPPTAAVSTARGEAGFLAALWRQILADLNVDHSQYEHAVISWIARQRSSNPYDQVHKRGNLRRELSDDKMTFKVFVRALKIIGASKMDFCIRLSFPNRKDTTHQRSMILLDVFDIVVDEDETFNIEDEPELEAIARDLAAQIKKEEKPQEVKSLPTRHHEPKDWVIDE